MDILRNRYLIIVATASLLMIINTECRLEELRCRDIIKALTYLQMSMPSQLPLDHRCKRYISLLALAEIRGTPLRSAVYQLATMHEAIIDVIYRDIGVDRRKSLYTGAIYRYRASKLEPPFIDLVACLRQTDTSLSGSYLTEELDLILDLYKKVMDWPAFTIDLDAIDLSRFDPAFKTALKNLFKENLGQNHYPYPPLQPVSVKDYRKHAIERRRYRQRVNQQRFREKNLHSLQEKDRARKRELAKEFREQFLDANDIVHPGESTGEGPDPIVDPPEAEQSVASTSGMPGDLYQAYRSAERRRYLRNERQRRFRERNLQRIRERQRQQKRETRERSRATSKNGLHSDREKQSESTRRREGRPLGLMDQLVLENEERLRQINRERAFRFREKNRERLNQKQRERRQKRREEEFERSAQLKQPERVTTYADLMPKVASSQRTEVISSPDVRSPEQVSQLFPVQSTEEMPSERMHSLYQVPRPGLVRRVNPKPVVPNVPQPETLPSPYITTSQSFANVGDRPSSFISSVSSIGQSGQALSYLDASESSGAELFRSPLPTIHTLTTDISKGRETFDELQISAGQFDETDSVMRAFSDAPLTIGTPPVANAPSSSRLNFEQQKSSSGGD